MRRRHRRRRHVPNLLDQKLPLINKLLIIGPILQKMRQEMQQLLPVHNQDLLHGDRLIGVGHKDFKDVEALVLYHLAVVAQQVHADLEVLAAVHVGGHDVVVGAVEQDLAEELDGLALGHVAVGLDQDGVVFAEEELEVGG